MLNSLKNLFILIALVISFVVSIASPAFAGPFDTCDYTIALSDNKYGFVWKPSGAHRPDAVLVLPGRFKGSVPGTHNKTVRSVTLYRADTLAKVDTMDMKSDGVCPPTAPECLDRPTFFDHKHLTGKALSRKYGRIRIRVVTNVQSHVHCTAAFDPAIRQD